MNWVKIQKLREWFEKKFTENRTKGKTEIKEQEDIVTVKLITQNGFNGSISDWQMLYDLTKDCRTIAFSSSQGGKIDIITVTFNK